MKRKALVFGVVFAFLLGFGQVLAVNVQEKSPDFKLISAKELAKELRNPDSGRIRASGYLIELDIASSRFEDWMAVSSEVALNIIFKMDSDEEFLELRNNPVNFQEILLSQDFEFSQFEQGFSKLHKIFTKLVGWLQEGLDSSQSAHRQVMGESTELLRKIENPERFIQGYSQYQIDCFRAFYIYEFARAWAKMASVTLDQELTQEIPVIGAAMQAYILDETVDKNSEEFKKTFSDYMTKLNAKLEELIQFIEKL